MIHTNKHTCTHKCIHTLSFTIIIINLNDTYTICDLCCIITDDDDYIPFSSESASSSKFDGNGKGCIDVLFVTVFVNVVLTSPARCYFQVVVLIHIPRPHVSSEIKVGKMIHISYITTMFKLRQTWLIA